MFAGMLFWFFVKFSFGRSLLIKVQQKKTTIWQYRVSCHSYWSIYINKSCPKKCCGAHVLPAFSQYPELFSFGLFSKAGPTKKQVRCIHSTLSWLWKKDHCRLTNLSYVCVCVCVFTLDGRVILPVCLLWRGLHRGAGPHKGKTKWQNPHPGSGSR